MSIGYCADCGSDIGHKPTCRRLEKQAKRSELEQLRKELLAAQAVIEQMRETIQHHSDCQNCCIHDGDSEALSIQSPTDTLKARDRKRDAALLRFLASQTRKSAHAAEIEAIAKRRESGEWEPELEVK